MSAVNNPNRLLEFVMSISAVSIVAFAIKKDDPLAPVTVAKSYHSDDFGSVGLVGACSADPRNIRCWDSNGIPDSGLTEKIQAFHSPGHPLSTLNFKFHRKTRLLVF